MASHAFQIVNMPVEQRKEFFTNQVPDDLKPMVRKQVQKYFRDKKNNKA